MALKTARFEKEYVQAHAHTLQILEAERDRVHRMEQLLLRIENENLQLQINRTSQEVTQAREAEIDVRFQLDSATGELDHLQNVVQASSREIENLRHELTSLSAIASDSQKLQVEKVRLAKEVSSLQHEVEKLGLQGTSNNTILAEKQAITRQLNAAEVQLENEKRAHERSLARQTQQSEEVATLTSKLEEAQRELELARRHIQDDTQQRDRALMSHQSPISGIRGGIQADLAIAKDRDQQGTPVQQREGWSNTTTRVPIGRPIGIHTQKPTSRLHSELTIATPGAVRAKGQVKQSSTLPGDKSAFSITPFLNRTTSLEDSSTSSDDELNETNNIGNDGSGTPTVSLTKQLKPPATKQLLKAGKQGSTEAAVDGNARSREKQKALDSCNRTESYQVSLSRPAGHKQALSKKRKLGLQRDRSLFDEDEDDNTMQETRKPGRKLAGTGHTSLAGNRAFAGPMGVQQYLQKRYSSKRWQARQMKDHFTREAAVQGLKSRAAFKLLQGYAPGSWSQVALTRTQPNGRVLGVDIIPSQPPRGVSTIQGNFLDLEVQAYVRDFVRNPRRGRPFSQLPSQDVGSREGIAESVLEASPTSASLEDAGSEDSYGDQSDAQRTVDVVLSDMSAPWLQTTGFWKKSLSNPYNRMMNTSGLAFRDHAGSMDLCRAALEFSYEVLKAGGHFICKFYQGAEDKDLEKQLRVLFQKVHRLKPESSRSESKEAFFIGLDRKPHAKKQDVLMTP
ncbi:FtsJ-like methyltransferase-domain-containing protein [Aspergillus undulatus]|uniref:FtsJ-like methyltransferase-domain-containing protein n=1 Tax=Aspergillus undulatus TaxID=1810928 RepID=UPI003CCDEBC1